MGWTEMDRTNLWRHCLTPTILNSKFTPFCIFTELVDGLLTLEMCSWRFKSKYQLCVTDIFFVSSVHTSSIRYICVFTRSTLVISMFATPCLQLWNYYETQRPQLERWTVKTISCCARADGVSNLCFGVRGFWHNCLMRVMCKWYLLIVTGLSFGILIWSIFSLFKVKSTWQTVSNPCSFNVVSILGFTYWWQKVFLHASFGDSI